MNLLVHKSMWLLIWLRFKGWLRAQFSGKSVMRLVGAVVGAVVFLLWMLNAVMWPVLTGRRSSKLLTTTPEDVINFASLGLGAITAMTLIFGGGTKLMTFRPAELDFVVPGPYSPRTLINYKLLTLFASGLFSGIFYSIFFARHTGHFVSAFVAGVLATLFATLAGITLGLVGEISGSRKLLVLGVARGAIAAGVAWIVYRFVIAAREAQVAAVQAAEAAGTDGAKRLEAMNGAISVRTRVAGVMEETIVSVLTLPFRPFGNLFAASTFAQACLWASVCVIMVVALWSAIVFMQRAWQEMAVRVSEQTAKAAEKMVKGTRERGTLSKRLAAFAPQLQWMGPTRAIARRHLTASMPMVIFAPLLGAMVPLALSYMVRTSEDTQAPAIIGAIAGFGMLPAVIFVAPALLRMDFRNDLDHIETLKTLPFSATRLVSAQLFTPLLVSTLMAWALAGAAMFVGGEAILKHIDLGVVVLVFAAMPIIILIVLCIDNALFLLVPERPMQAKGVNVAVTGKRVLTMAARLLTFGITLAPAALLAWLVYFFSDSLFAAGVTALVIAGAAAIAGVLLVAWTFRRFDVSRDMPE